MQGHATSLSGSFKELMKEQEVTQRKEISTEFLGIISFGDEDYKFRHSSYISEDCSGFIHLEVSEMY